MGIIHPIRCIMKIAKLRKLKNLTQADLAKSCATSQQQIAKIEGGIVDPRLSTLRTISEALGCELSALFYTRREFLDEISSVIREESVDLKKTKLTQLNALCACKCDLPAFHPFWEEIQITNKGTVVFTEK
jgi:transcriptional regulator with XRE-family HTH domain